METCKRWLGRRIGILCLLVVTAGLFAGCTMPGRLDVNQSAVAYAELSGQYNSKNCEKIGFKADSGADAKAQDQKRFQRYYKESFFKLLRGRNRERIYMGLSSQKEWLDQVVEARMEAQQRMKITASGGDEKDTPVILTVKVTGVFNEEEIFDQAIAAADAAMQAPEVRGLAPKAQGEKAAAVLLQKMIDVYNNVGTDTEESFEACFIKHEKFWGPKDEQLFQDMLENAMEGRDADRDADGKAIDAAKKQA